MVSFFFYPADKKKLSSLWVKKASICSRILDFSGRSSGKFPAVRKVWKGSPVFLRLTGQKCPKTSLLLHTHVSFSRLFCCTRDWFVQIVKRDFRAKFFFTTCPYVFWTDRFAFKWNRYTTLANGNFCNSVQTNKQKKQPNRRYIYLYETIHPV